MTGTGKLMPAAAIAVVVLSALGGVLLAGHEPPAEPARQEPDLFPFLRLLPQAGNAAGVPEPAYAESAIDPRWRSLFERHFIQAGDKSPELIRRAVAAELESLLPQQRAQALAVLEKYLRYRQEMTALQSATDDASRLGASVGDLRVLRARIFTPQERDVLFASDEAYEDLWLARQAIAEDRTLTDDERHLRLQEIEASVTDEIRQAEEMRTGVVRIVPSIAPVAGEDDVYRLAPGQQVMPEPGQD